MTAQAQSGIVLAGDEGVALGLEIGDSVVARGGFISRTGGSTLNSIDEAEQDWFAGLGLR